MKAGRRPPPRRRCAGGAVAGRAAAISGATFALALALVVGLASFAATTPAAAATRWYRVEVVVFAQGADDESWSRNDWREEGPPALAENTVELLPGLEAAGSNRPRAFRTLPASALALGAVADRLDGSTDHRVLLHVGWDQPGFSDDEAPAVHLGTLTGAEERAAGTDVKEVEGSIRFWRRRFLHVDVDLSFGDIEGWRERRAGATPAAVRPDGGSAVPGPATAGARTEMPERPAEGAAGSAGGSAAEDGGPQANATHGAGAAAGPLRVTRLTRNLRLRSGRLHYIDHPLFGVLLAIRRLYPPSR